MSTNKADLAELKVQMRAVADALGTLVKLAEIGTRSSYTLKEWRERHGLSESQHMKLKRQKRHPREMQCGEHKDGKGRRISREADLNFIRDREREAVDEEEGASPPARDT
jgi:hypothetical protein